MATPDCIDVGSADSFLSADANRLQGRITRSLAINSPWINLIETGTFPSRTSDTQRSVVQEAIAPALSQCSPNWESFSCNAPFGTVSYGNTEYQYALQQYREKSAVFCLPNTYSSLRDSIRMVEMAYSDHLTTLWNSFIRGQMLAKSATKVVANSTATSLSDILTSGFATNFKAGVSPNAPISFKFLKYLANYLTHSLLAGPEFQWKDNGMNNFRFISDQNTIDLLRNEANVRADLRAFAAGSFAKEGKDAIQAFSWEGPYQGISFGIDQSITRASGVNGSGEICCVEPFTTAAATNGVKRAVNTDWLSAPYQVSYLVAKNSFVRQIPEEFTGEGKTRFDIQNWAGKITWHNQKDNCNNIAGDQGFHWWQLAAALRPERPQFVIPILHTRCVDDLGLEQCTHQGYYTSCV